MFSECAKHLKGHSTFFGNRLILPELNSWVLPFSNPFSRFSDIWKNISNQTVSGPIDFHIFCPSMEEVNGTRNWYSSKYQKLGWMDSKTVKLNCLTLGSCKMNPFPKKGGVSL